MARPFRRSLLGLATLLGLAGCSSLVLQERPAWRLQAENACLARGAVHESATLVPAREMSGPGICGLVHPFKVTALAEGTVTLNATQTLDCPMIEALDGWLKEVVQPAAQARFGEPVVRINSLGSYSCRGINNMSGASLSEHAFGNALDIGGFVLAGGRELNITRGFNGPDEQESAFLHEVHAGACGLFTTVLGPGYNILHYNHFHVDLAMHGATSRGPRRYCKPVPRNDLPQPPKVDTLPDPPAIEEEMDIARAPAPEPGLGPSGGSLVASLPPPPPAPRTQAAPPPPLSALALAAPEPHRRLLPTPAPHGFVTFAVDDPEATLPSAPPVPRHELRRLPPASEADTGMGATDDPAGESPREPEVAPTTAPTRAPANSDQGQPSDWDITSSTKR